MILPYVVLYVVSSVFCGLWAAMLIYMYRTASGMPLLCAQGTEYPDEGDWPLVSVVVPACNEADHIEAALTSLLAQDYPRLEVVVIDDRSRDATGEIVDRIAAADPRVRAVHVESLPAGWLGKVNALHEGTLRASGAWWLFTDADVRFAPGVLRRAVVYAARHGVDHVTCLPEITGAGFLLRATIRAFGMLFCASVRLGDVNRGRSPQAVGIGAFNLVAADAFARTPGFEWLRMEPADDVGLGAMLKQAGARTHVLNGHGQVSVTWYENLRAMMRGLEKNSFGSGANFSYTRQALIVTWLSALAVLPPFSLLAGLLWQDAVLAGLGGIALAVSAFGAWRMPRGGAGDVAAHLGMPIGCLLIAFMMLRAAYVCRRNGGVDRRGTRYGIEELRRGQRVRF